MILFATVPVAARPQQAPQPPALASLFQCRAIADDKARLACFDREATTLQAADQKGDLMVASRQDVREAKRGLFGFDIHLGLFDHHESADHGREDEVKEITAKAKRAERDGSGYWVVTLDDGAVWQQTEARTLGHWPKAGSTVTIRRAVLGSYRMSFDGGPAVKARRVE